MSSEALITRMKCAKSPNDPKLSDRGVRRGTCTAGGKAAAAAGAVTHGAVRCSAWLGVCVGVAPALRRSTESGLVLGPIVKRRGVEVGSARPDNRMDLRVECDLRKSSRVTERAVKLALENRLEINGAGQTIVEAQVQRVRPDALDGGDAVNGMVHGVTLLQRRDWGRLAALLQKAPVGKQLLLVKLRPSLDETLLALRNEADDEGHGQYGKDGNVLAVVGVKVRDMMPLGWLGEHPNDDAVKA